VSNSRIPGTFKNKPPDLKRDLSPQGAQAEQWLLKIGALHAERWTLGDCTIMIAREPMNHEYRWHLSIAHPLRYPTWDEIKAACCGIEAVNGVMLAQVMTPGDGSPWVNVHENCMHLYEIHDEAVQQ
jgi:hypothetical protein